MSSYVLYSINYVVSVNQYKYCYKLPYNYITHVVNSCIVLIMWSIIIWHKYNSFYNHSIDVSKLCTVLTVLSRTILILLISPQPKTPVMRWGTEKSHFKCIQVYNFFYNYTLCVVKFGTALIVWSRKTADIICCIITQYM